MKKIIKVSFVLIFLLLILFFIKLRFNMKSTKAVRKGQANIIKIMTYNIHSGIHGTEKIVRFIKSSGADLIFLQEAMQRPNKKFPDPVPKILAELPDWHHIRGGSSQELIILSRNRILNKEERKLGAYRPCLMGEIKFRNVNVRLINVHFNTGPIVKNSDKTLGDLKRIKNMSDLKRKFKLELSVRKEQADALIKIMSESEEKIPLIVAGDFNSPPFSYPHKVMIKNMIDCFDQSGSGFGLTFPVRFPVLRIDYIFASHAFKVKSCKTIPTKASDHLPVSAELVVQLQ